MPVDWIIGIIIAVIFLCGSVYCGIVSIKAFCTRKRSRKIECIFFSALSIICLIGSIKSLLPDSFYGSLYLPANVIMVIIVLFCVGIVLFIFASSYLKERERQKIRKVATNYPSRMGLRNPESAAAAKTIKAVIEAALIKPKRV